MKIITQKTCTLIFCFAALLFFNSVVAEAREFRALRVSCRLSYDNPQGVRVGSLISEAELSHAGDVSSFEQTVLIKTKTSVRTVHVSGSFAAIADVRRRGLSVELRATESGGRPLVVSNDEDRSFKMGGVHVQSARAEYLILTYPDMVTLICI